MSTGSVGLCADRSAVQLASAGTGPLVGEVRARLGDQRDREHQERPHRRQEQEPVPEDPVEHDQIAQFHDLVDEGLLLLLLVLEQIGAEHRSQRHGQEQRAADQVERGRPDDEGSALVPGCVRSEPTRLKTPFCPSEWINQDRGIDPVSRSARCCQPRNAAMVLRETAL